MTDAQLAAAVSQVVGAPVVRMAASREPLAYDAFLANRYVDRLRGTAAAADGQVQWSLIEKVTEGPAIASAYLYDNGQREFRAYESGLLEDLAPGLAAPVAHGLETSADGRLTLWLEDLGTDGRRLSAAEVPDTARHLGRLAGRWLGRVPDHAWLFGGWLDRHGQPEAVAPARERLRRLRSPTEIEARLGLRIADIEALIDDQQRIGSMLRALPPTLCHHDAVGANVIRRTRAGSDETVLIDWEMVGPGPVGVDLVSLLFSSARRGDLSASDAIALLPGALDAYAAGMADLGATADAEALGRTVNAAIALRWVLARDVIVALDDGTPIRRGSAPAESPEAALAELVALTRMLLDAAGKVR